MKYLVLLYRAEDTLECEAYWTDDYDDAVDMAENEEYASATLVTASEIQGFNM